MATLHSWLAKGAYWCAPLLAALGLCGFAPSAIGATTITPVIIDVPWDGRAIVTVRNDSAREALYQITVFDWRVVNGTDKADQIAVYAGYYEDSLRKSGYGISEAKPVDVAKPDIKPDIKPIEISVADVNPPKSVWGILFDLFGKLFNRRK